jgi:LuxR family transcriptional regulator
MIRQYINSIVNCQSMEELWDKHTEKMAEYGFDRLIYGLTRYRTSSSLGDPEDMIILSNHSQEYLDMFIGQKRYVDAPMVRWALTHEGAGSWAMINEIMASELVSDKERQVYEFNQRHGVTAGYTISFKSVSARSKGAIALTGQKGLSQADIDAIWQEHGRDIHLMNNVAHLKILTLPYNGPKRALTKRQREALEWVGDGKTMQDIAAIMGLTTATVEKHLRLAREALAVETTAQAVLKTAFANQMFILDNEL